MPQSSASVADHGRSADNLHKEVKPLRYATHLRSRADFQARLSPLPSQSHFAANIASQVALNNTLCHDQAYLRSKQVLDARWPRLATNLVRGQEHRRKLVEDVEIEIRVAPAC
jgi:hypothetical protein